MLPKAKTVYFHVDVNSAFLSWTAIQHLANGETLDLPQFDRCRAGF